MARSFSGSGRVNCGNVTIANNTVSAYCWANGPGTANDAMIDISNRFTFYFDGSNNLVLEIGSGSGAAGASWNMPVGGLGTLSVWNHWGVTYDATSGANDPIFYKNGVALGAPTETDAPGTWALTSAAMQIGNFGSGTGPFEGSIAHVAYHNLILTAGEMAHAYVNGVVWGRGLLRYYPLDGQTTEPDYSGNVANSTSITATSTITDGPPTQGPFIINFPWVPPSTAPANITVISPAASLTLNSGTQVAKHTAVATAASLTLSAPTHIVKHNMRPTAASLSLSGAAPVPKHTLPVVPASLALSAGTPVVRVTEVTPPMSLTLGAAAPTVVQSDTVVVPTGATVTLSAAAPVSVHSMVGVAAELTLEGGDDTLVTRILPPAGSLTLSAAAPTFAESDTVVAPPASITLESPEPTITVTITTPPGSIGLDAASPVVAGDDTTVISPGGTLTLQMPTPGIEAIDGYEYDPNDWFVIRKRRRRNVL